MRQEVELPIGGCRKEAQGAQGEGRDRMTEAGVLMQGLLVASCGLQVAGRALRGVSTHLVADCRGRASRGYFSVAAFPYSPFPLGRLPRAIPGAGVATRSPERRALSGCPPGRLPRAIPGAGAQHFSISAFQHFSISPISPL